MHIMKDKINEEKASVKMLNWKSKWDSWTVISVYALSQQQLHILHLPTPLQPQLQPYIYTTISTAESSAE